MNYRHSFHAGNFADVIKHVLITALIQSLKKKHTSFCYIDTHAGMGYYDLSAEDANKTEEYRDGIEKIIHADHPPLLIKEYLNCVHKINNKLSDASFASLRYYPGSAMIARSLIRPEDRIVACELQTETYQELKNAFNYDKQVAVHHMDGFLGLKAFLPPKERRGLILIDPPYENPDEFANIPRALSLALKRFETGIYAIWYPIKEHAQLKSFYKSLTQHIKQTILIIELTIYDDSPHRLNGCGIAIINPPWQLDTTLQESLPWLWNVLKINGQGGFNTFILD